MVDHATRLMDIASFGMMVETGTVARNQGKAVSDNLSVITSQVSEDVEDYVNAVAALERYGHKHTPHTLDEMMKEFELEQSTDS